LLLLGSCDEKSANPNKNLSIDAFAKWKADEYALNSQLIDESLEHLCKQDKDSATADFRTRDYYRHGGAKVWVNRQGASHWADTLLSVLNATVPDMGFTPRSFRMEQIDADLRRLQNLDFDTDNSISQVAARLEYNLTKAYLRYALGQRYGFVNPTYLFNHLLIVSTFCEKVRSISVEDMNVFLLDVDVIEEVVPHKAVIAFWMTFRQSHIFVHVERNHILE
jgi:hypothetical protein